MLFDHTFTTAGARRGRLTASCAVAAAILSLLVTSARAQEYKTDIPDAEARKLALVAANCIRNPATYAQSQTQFEDFFRKAYFPMMTGTLPDELAKLGDYRYNLFKKFLWASDNDQLQAGLTEIAYQASLNIIKPQTPSYHPAVQYNAVLTLGMLDEQYAREGAAPRPPKPLPKATKALTRVIETATAADPKQQFAFAPPVILGAVIGLERHAQLHDQVAPADVQAMTNALLKLIGTAQPIQGMDRNAYAWLQLRAASALAALGNVGTNNAIHDGLIKLVGSLRSLDDRCAAAALLAKIKYEGAKVDGAATANGLFTLTRDVAADDSKKAKEFQDTEIGVRPGAVGAQPALNAMGGPVAERFPRRQVLERLVDLRSGLTAAKPVLPAEEQPKVDAVLAAINPVIAVASDTKGTVELKLTQAIVAMAEAIQRAIPAPAVAAAPPAAASAATPPAN